MDIAEVAAGYGGQVTWTFSQGGLATWIRYREYAWMGICAALSANWIKDHANDGSLANSLGGGNVGALSVAKIRQVGAQHAFATATHRQTDMLILWLKMHDIIPVGVSWAHPRRKVDETPGPLRGNSGPSFKGASNTEHAQERGNHIDVAAGIVAAMQRIRPHTAMTAK